MIDRREDEGKGVFSFVYLTTNFGRIVTVWHSTGNRIVRIFLPKQYSMFRSSVFHRLGVERSPLPAVAEQCRHIVALLHGEDVTFDLAVFDWSVTSRFQQCVLFMEKKIPRGMVSTYSRIALKIGNPSAARAVGNALARNPFPLVIPCHRAIRNDGSLGGYAGGIDMKKKLLLFEGLQIDRRGRVITNKYW